MNKEILSYVFNVFIRQIYPTMCVRGQIKMCVASHIPHHFTPGPITALKDVQLIGNYYIVL